MSKRERVPRAMEQEPGGSAMSDENRASEGDDKTTSAGSPMLFFFLWFGIPLVAVVVIGLLMNHC